MNYKGTETRWYFEKTHPHPISKPISTEHEVNHLNAKKENQGTYYCYGYDLDSLDYTLSMTAVYVYGNSAFKHS